jgi:hypothetical protein
MVSATVTDPIQGRTAEKDSTMATKKTPKVSKVRMGAAVLLGTLGLSVAGALVPATASANPYVPFSGPLHPIRHYAADVLHPIYTITHPIRSLLP